MATVDSVEATAVIHIGKQRGLRFVFVMDWLWQRGRRHEGMQLMRQIIQVARDVDAVGVAALAMPGTAQRRSLRRLGFLVLPQRLFPEEITLEVLPVGAQAEAAQWFEPANWYLTFGDGNLL